MKILSSSLSMTTAITLTDLIAMSIILRSEHTLLILVHAITMTTEKNLTPQALSQVKPRNKNFATDAEIKIIKYHNVLNRHHHDVLIVLIVNRINLLLTIALSHFLPKILTNGLILSTAILMSHQTILLYQIASI